MTECECCGDEVDGLFPIVGHKYDDGDTYGDKTDYTWCGLCWSIGSCHGPEGGACYRHEIPGQENWDGYYDDWDDYGDEDALETA